MKNNDYRDAQTSAIAKHNMPDYIEAKMDELKALMHKKNEQYSSKNKPFDTEEYNDDLANFRAGAFLSHGSDSCYFLFEEAKDYCRKHIAHVYGPRQDADAEKIMESLGDIVIYSLIQMYLVEQRKAGM